MAAPASNMLSDFGSARAVLHLRVRGPGGFKSLSRLLQMVFGATSLISQPDFCVSLQVHHLAVEEHFRSRDEREKQTENIYKSALPGYFGRELLLKKQALDLFRDRRRRRAQQSRRHSMLWESCKKTERYM